MRRLVLLVLALALAASAAALAQGQAPPPPLAARLVTCQTGPTPGDRFAVFSGSMPTAAGAASMAMRFDLFERRPGGAFQHVALAKWGVWERTSRPGVPGFIFTKRVEQLAAPAAFRATVRFRWYDAHGKLLRSARRISPLCRQPDPRPDLVPMGVTAKAAGAGNATYTVLVRNGGRGDAGPFAVSVAGVQGQLAGLPAQHAGEVVVKAPRCRAGGRVTVAVDPADAVDESREGNDTRSFPCPLGRRR